MQNAQLENSQKTSGHVAYLDSVRGLAALMVVNEHYVIAYGLPCQSNACKLWLDFSPLHFWWDGTAAVSMFFVLSGLVLSLKYFRNGPKPELIKFSLAGFTVNRFLRIWLPYCIVLVISGIMYTAVAGSEPLVTRLPADNWITGMWRNNALDFYDMLREGFLPNLPETIVIIPQAWTLTLELVISLLLPVGLLLAQRGHAWVIFFGLYAVGFLGVSIFLLHFLLGMLLASYHSTIISCLQLKIWLRYLILGVGLLLFTAADNPFRLFSENQLWLITGLGAGLLLVFTASSKSMQTWLTNPYLRQIGKVSYSVYLIHMALLICLTPSMLLLLETITQERFLLWLGGWLATLIMTILAATLSHRYIELPCMEQGKHLNNLLLSRGKGDLTKTMVSKISKSPYL